ncbi:Hypothetical protein GLP15_2205 [Giardia lamblia P15]|uniref:Uncharacterized protein n=1 Tax=Giardia intestinalis (strain P15) TaxID=658858 RepID=E1F6U6_GIAIA|nr:Hypothetical protein GLP15_2205 [Giardia lamblia P15]
MNAKLQVPHKDTSGQCLQRDPIYRELISSMETELVTTCFSHPGHPPQPCTETSQSIQQSFNASCRPSVAPVAPILPPNLTSKFHTLSSYTQQALSPLERERPTVSKIPAITSATVQKTLRSLSPLSPVSQPLSRIPSLPSPADLPICVLRALDQGYWPEFARIPEASLKRGYFQ